MGHQRHGLATAVSYVGGQFVVLSGTKSARNRRWPPPPPPPSVDSSVHLICQQTFREKRALYFWSYLFHHLLWYVAKWTWRASWLCHHQLITVQRSWLKRKSCQHVSRSSFDVFFAISSVIKKLLANFYYLVNFSLTVRFYLIVILALPLLFPHPQKRPLL